MAELLVATFSIAACDLDAGQWGVATQSKFLAVGSVVPWAEPQAGAIATQAYANPRYGPDGLALLREGATAAEVVQRLTEADDGRDRGYAGLSDTLVDLRVDDHPEPIEELERIYRMHDLLFGRTPRERWLDVDDELRAELEQRLAALGYTGDLERAFAAWTGTENL